MTDQDKTWTTEMALESLAWIMRKYGIDGGVSALAYFYSREDFSPQLADTDHEERKEFLYNPVADVLKQLYTQGKVVD